MHWSDARKPPSVWRCCAKCRGGGACGSRVRVRERCGVWVRGGHREDSRVIPLTLAFALGFAVGVFGMVALALAGAEDGP